jgi:hypothetical protein
MKLVLPTDTTYDEEEKINNEVRRLLLNHEHSSKLSRYFISDGKSNRDMAKLYESLVDQAIININIQKTWSVGGGYDIESGLKEEDKDEITNSGNFRLRGNEDKHTNYRITSCALI